MVTANRVYVHFDKLSEFMIKELYDCKAKPLAWAICWGHINRLPQYQYRCDINQFLPMSISGLEHSPKALKGSLETISHLIMEKAPGVAQIASEARTQLSEIGGPDPVVIVRQTAPDPVAPTDRAAAAPTKKKRNTKEWAYANALFAGPDSAWYDFVQGNNVVKMAKKEFKDLDAFCEWRQEKNRTGLATNIIEVRKEYERFKTPALDLTAMAPAKAAPAPIYRKINLGEL